MTTTRQQPAPNGPARLAHLAEAVAYFGITNECLDASHREGIHRHGALRYVRWPKGEQRITPI